MIVALVRAQRPPVAAMPAPLKSVSGRAPDRTYIGVILVMPPKTHAEMVPPPPPEEVAEVGRVRRRQVTVPFDGAYWYFKQPDERPRPGAPVVRGDPRTKSLRSTDARPLAMEAHQRLRRPMAMGCCRMMRLTVENAEAGAGVIAVEVVLKGGTARQPRAQTLGVQVLPSSREARSSPGGAAVEESLSFAFPAHAAGWGFDEIVVVIRRPAGERAREGARVAVKAFELVP